MAACDTDVAAGTTPCEETIFAPGACLLCGRDPAAGFASIGDHWFCHGDCDPVPTCYMLAQGAAADDHRKLVLGEMTAEEYVRRLKVRVDARMGWLP